MVKPQLLFVVGCLIGLAGTLADMFFKASFFRRLPAFGYGYRCHADRDLGETPLKEPTFISASTVTSTTLRSLSLARRAAGLVVSFFGLQHSDPDFSLGLILGICIFTFVFCAVVFYWQLFIRVK